MEKSKLEKYREERARHLEKIADLQKRVRALDQRIMENESMEIRALMRSENVTLEELFNLINERQTSNKCTVLSTNLTMNELKTRYTERILSRFRDAHACQTLQFLGRDIRQLPNR